MGAAGRKLLIYETSFYWFQLQILHTLWRPHTLWFSCKSTIEQSFKGLTWLMILLIIH